MESKTRSPLKGKPLRLPGQSVSEEREKFIEDAVAFPMFLALFFVLIAALEWWKYFNDLKPNPVLYSIAAVVLVLYAAYRIWRSLPKLRRLRQALEGERVVGQFLERLHARGFHVFHDVVGDRFNVDHVLVGPAGVFTVETKTWSKPVAGRSEIIFDGEQVSIGGVLPDRNPVLQAKAQAGWIRSVLLESAGRDIAVRPVVVFPGWFIMNKARPDADVWVLEPKALPSFLDHEPGRLSPEDVKLLSYHLSRLVRSMQS